MNRRHFFTTLGAVLAWLRFGWTPDVWRDGDAIHDPRLRDLLTERMIAAGIPIGTVITAVHANRFIPKAQYAPRGGRS